MKQFFKWIGKHIAGALVFSLFSILFIAGIVYALTYPSAPPAGEVAGGKFMQYFNNMRQTCGAGEIMNGSKADNSPNCIPVTPDTPTGAIMAFNLSSCPTGWSSADGNGGRPDLRGEFIRGLDNGRGIDSGRALGSSQLGSKVGTTFGGIPGTNTYGNGQSGAYGTWWSDSLYFILLTGGDTDGPKNIINVTDMGAPTGHLPYVYNNTPVFFEYRISRPRNVAFLYCIKN